MVTDFFDERVAATYDSDVEDAFDASALEATADFLSDLAAGHRVLEFGIGTGRVALPLADRGVVVDGIDLSEAMVQQLRRKAGGAAFDVTIGDFATASTGRTYGLVYLVFNTIMNLTTQDEQVQCFLNAADHLAGGGHFVVEVLVPDLQRLPPGETFRPAAVDPDHVGFDEIDPSTQSLISHHYYFRDGESERRSIPFRYVWPSELDLMARIAGMRLVQRWADWRRTPFTSASRKHVSVWRTSS